MRELLGNLKNRSRSEKVSTKVPIEFAENPQLVPGATTSGAETQSRSESNSTSTETSLGGRISNAVGENVNEHREQDSEDNLEFLMIERQI